MGSGRIVVVGLGPAGPELVTAGALTAIDRAPLARRRLRTGRHPSAGVVGPAATFDEHYERADTFDEVYRGIVDELALLAGDGDDVVFAVPGSPFVLERTVRWLRSEQHRAPERFELEIVPGMSFVDLAWGVLGVDPIEVGARLVDGHRFAQGAAGEPGPMLVAHTHAPHVLSDIKLAAEHEPGDTPVVVLQRLGLPDQAVFEVAWEDLDRCFEPDHLTALWIPKLAAPVGKELVELTELTRTLRQQCPWDRAQTHRSLTRHLVEECYELVEAIENLDVDSGDGYEHLEEELGDVLFQVTLHSAIAEQAGQFSIADVAHGIHDKLVRRHPHVFGSTVVTGAAELATSWEELKQAEKARTSALDGIAPGLPALAYASTVQRKAARVRFDWSSVAEAVAKVAEEAAELTAELAAADPVAREAEFGDLLFSVVGVARHLDIDAESALRAATARFRDRFVVVERLAAERGVTLRDAADDEVVALWDEAKRVVG